MQTISEILKRTNICPSDGPHPIICAPAPEVARGLARHYTAQVLGRGGSVDSDAAIAPIETAARWLTEPGKPWLFLSGNCGTGKTTLLRAIHKTLVERGVPARAFCSSDFPTLFLNNAEYTDRKLLRGEFCRVLLLDDIGVDQDEIKFYGNIIRPFVKIVESRYNALLPMVVSTNLSGAEMRETYGERTIDRICEMAAAIRYEGKSFRKSSTN